MSAFAQTQPVRHKLLAAIGRSGGDLRSVADLVDAMLDSPQMADAVRCFRALPG